jgi:urease accessory protein
MRASARIVAESDGRGGIRLAVLRCESPLLLRRTGPVTVHLVGGAAGPLRGDDLRLAIEVGPGARLDLQSVAAALALPGRPGAAPSRLEITATVGPGGCLRWRPQPLIAAAGCDHRAVTEIEVAEGGRLLWRDELVCGRHGEDSGDVRSDITVRYGGRTLYRHDLAVGPAAPGWSGAAVLGRSDAAVPGLSDAVPGLSGAAVPGLSSSSGAAVLGLSGAAVPGGGRAVGSVVLAGSVLPVGSVLPTGLPVPGRPGGDAAVMPLAGPGLLATAVGTDIRQVRAVLDVVCAADADRPSAPPTRHDHGRPQPAVA